MAMRKEPERRYGSAQQMSSDIQRYLDGKPVIARRDTLSYRIRKIRQAPLAAGERRGCGAALLVLAFAITTYVQSVRIAAERDRVAQQRELAEHERARAEEVSSFLVNLFKLSDPEENRGNQVTARELLDSGAKRLQAGLQDQPATKAALVVDRRSRLRQPRAVPGRAADAWTKSLHLQGPIARQLACRYAAGTRPCAHRCGRSAAAEPPLQEALHLAQSDAGAKSVETGRALGPWACCDIEQGQIREAKELYHSEPGILELEQGAANRYFAGARRSGDGVYARSAMGAGETDL